MYAHTTLHPTKLEVAEVTSLVLQGNGQPYERLKLTDADDPYGSDVTIFTDHAGLERLYDALSIHLAAKASAEIAVEQAS